MRINEADWAQLEAEHHAHGLVIRRLFPRSGHDIFLAVEQPTGRRMLVLRVPGAAVEAVVRHHPVLPITRGLTMQFASAIDGNRELQVALTSDDRREVFNPLITDMAATAQAAPGPREALTAAIDRFEHWRHLLQSVSDTGMSSEARRGLYGELVVLRDHMLPHLHPDEAVAAWSGPTGTNQDFQLRSCAIEVKTTMGKGPQSMVISNERQLDDTGTSRLLLAHLSVDERRGGTGESLNQAVAALRAAITTPIARTSLDDLLIAAGYLPSQQHLYEEPRYTVRHTSFWHVTDDFPRIVEADLRPGVGDCRYHISTAGLDKYTVAAEQVASIVKGKM